MSSGYSGTPLAKKLGVKVGMRVVAVGAPEGYLGLLAPLPTGAAVDGQPDRGQPLAFVHLFARSRAELDERLEPLRSALARNGVLWVSWPKGAAKVATDLNREVVREAGLAAGLVDVKVCSVDATWSGLKFVYRLVDR